MNIDHKSGFVVYVENISRNYFDGFTNMPTLTGIVWRVAIAIIAVPVAGLSLLLIDGGRYLSERITTNLSYYQEDIANKIHTIREDALTEKPKEKVRTDLLQLPPSVQDRESGKIKQKEIETVLALKNESPAAAPLLVVDKPNEGTLVDKSAKWGWSADLPDFSHIDSSKLVKLNVSGVGPNAAPNREQFLNDPNYQTDPPVLSTCPWVPKELIEHLMKHKRREAYNTKWLGGQQVFNSIESRTDCITNMEGAMHTFFTPLIKVILSSDFVYAAEQSAVQSLGGKGRPVIMSAAIQPDMESIQPGNEVIFRICQLKDEVVYGEPLKDDFEVLSPAEKQNVKIRGEYDEKLRKHMIYHLTSSHALASQQDVEIVDLNTCVSKIEALIGNQNATSKDLEKMAVQIGGRVLSLEVLYNLYKNQLENELLALEKLCPQGYVYSIDPPHIFLAAIGGSSNGQFLNRLQALAIKEIASKGLLKNMKKVCFAHFSDRQGVKHYQRALGAGIEVIKKHALPGDNIGPFVFQKEPSNVSLKKGATLNYLIREPCAFVIHNNSDAFGQNIQHEGSTSADGYLGCFSDASLSLLREREDLCSHIVNPRSSFP